MRTRKEFSYLRIRSPHVRVFHVIISEGFSLFLSSFPVNVGEDTSDEIWIFFHHNHHVYNYGQIMDRIQNRIHLP